MKFLSKTFLIGLLLSSGANSQAEWMTDYSSAQAEAKRRGVPMLLDFTGSDWCGWCIKLKREVFDQVEFQAFADRNLVLVEIDFPQRKAQSASQKKANRELAQRYRVGGYPTLVIVDADGKEMGRTGYRPGGPGPLVKELASLIGAPVPGNSAPSPRAKRETAQKNRPLYGGAPLQPPPTYDELELKGISGSPDRRFALINNTTFVVGETAAVRMGQSQIKVRCLEIKEDSVLVEVGKDKEQREIFLTKSH